MPEITEEKKSGVPNSRDRLLAVGLRRIHAMGYASAGLKEILDEADTPKGSFYHHFASKEAFAKEVLELYTRREGERAREMLYQGEGTPMERLRRYFEELVRVFGNGAAVSGCMIGNLSLEMADHSEVIQATLQRSFAKWQAAIAGVLQEAIDRGDIARSSDPAQLASFLLNSYEGALLRSKADKSDVALENFLHFAFDILLRA